MFFPYLKTSLPKRFRAISTNIGFLTGMNPYMFNECRLMPISQGAIFTGVWFLSSMDHFMPFQRNILSKTFLAHIADIRFFIGMNSFMSLHCIKCSKSLSTMLTMVRWVVKFQREGFKLNFWPQLLLTFKRLSTVQSTIGHHFRVRK